MAEDNKADGDKAAEQKNAPVDPDKVAVKVKPQHRDLPKKHDPAHEQIKEDNARNKQLSEKAKEAATKDVRKAITEAAPGGRQAQIDAAEKAAERAAESLPQRSIKEVQVDIPGEHPIVVPATEGAPPDPPRRKGI